MSHTVVYAPSAKRKISSDDLALAVVDAAVTFIKGDLRDNPRRVGKALGGELAGTHAASRGAYRILYKIDDERERITIVDIGYHAQIYRPKKKQPKRRKK